MVPENTDIHLGRKKKANVFVRGCIWLNIREKFGRKMSGVMRKIEKTYRVNLLLKIE